MLYSNTKKTTQRELSGLIDTANNNLNYLITCTINKIMYFWFTKLVIIYEKNMFVLFF